MVQHQGHQARLPIICFFCPVVKAVRSSFPKLAVSWRTGMCHTPPSRRSDSAGSQHSANQMVGCEGSSCGTLAEGMSPEPSPDRSPRKPRQPQLPSSTRLSTKAGYRAHSQSTRNVGRLLGDGRWRSDPPFCEVLLWQPIHIFVGRRDGRHPAHPTRRGRGRWRLHKHDSKSEKD